MKFGPYSMQLGAALAPALALGLANRMPFSDAHHDAHSKMDLPMNSISCSGESLCVNCEILYRNVSYIKMSEQDAKADIDQIYLHRKT